CSGAAAASNPTSESPPAGFFSPWHDTQYWATSASGRPSCVAGAPASAAPAPSHATSVIASLLHAFGGPRHLDVRSGQLSSHSAVVFHRGPVVQVHGVWTGAAGRERQRAAGERPAFEFQLARVRAREGAAHLLAILGEREVEGHRALRRGRRH